MQRYKLSTVCANNFQTIFTPSSIFWHTSRPQHIKSQRLMISRSSKLIAYMNLIKKVINVQEPNRPSHPKGWSGLFFLFIELSHLINWNYLKRASPKAANIHNRWWRERSERNLRFQCKLIWRSRRGRTQANYANISYVRPLRGRSYHHFLNRRLRCLRQLNQRL